MQATIVSAKQVESMSVRHHTVSEAARAMRVSETTVRRALRAAGVRRVAGQYVSGFALFLNVVPAIAVSFAE